MSQANPQPRYLPLPQQVFLPLDLAVALMEAAEDSIQRARRNAAHARRPRRGATLKPGAPTPLWNELAAAVRKQFRRRGDKVKLGRILGLPRQRINDLFRQRKYLPDAERTLMLLVWLQARSEGKDLG